MCVVKLRGKTGQPIALPMWQATQRFIKKFANPENPEGKLFNFKVGKDAMAGLQHRMKTIRSRVAEKLPKAADYSFQHFRDTGASYCDTVNPMLTTLYLAQGDRREAKQYVAAIEDEHGETIIPMQMDQVLAGFEKYLSLPTYKP